MSRKTRTKACKRISVERRNRWERFLGCVGTCGKDEPRVLCELGCYQKHIRGHPKV